METENIYRKALIIALRQLNEVTTQMQSTDNFEWKSYVKHFNTIIDCTALLTTADSVNKITDDKGE